MKLDNSYYQGTDVIGLSRDLIGKHLFTRIAGRITGGRIVETEAYAGERDKASHACGGRRTKRTEIMYHRGGVSYVYLCYGIHNLFNIITAPENVPHAVLIRAVEPVAGIGHMLERRNQSQLRRSTSGGPGLVCQALGIGRHHNGTELTGGTIWVEDKGEIIRPDDIAAGCRVGIHYAGEDATNLWRFRLKGNGYTSPAK